MSAAGSGHSYTYDFTTAVSGCPTGANANAGRNTNRSRLVDNGTAVVSYCYDMADREIAASGIAYDGHQNQTLHDGDTSEIGPIDCAVMWTSGGSPVLVRLALGRDQPPLIATTSASSGGVSSSRLAR